MYVYIYRMELSNIYIYIHMNGDGTGLQLFPGTSLSPNARTVTVTTSWPRKKPRTHPLLSLITGSRWFKLIVFPKCQGKTKTVLMGTLLQGNWRMPFARLFDKSHGNGSEIVKISCMLFFLAYHSLLATSFFYITPSHAADLLGLLKTWGVSCYTLVHGNSMQLYIIIMIVMGTWFINTGFLGWQTKLGPMVLRIQERVQRRYMTGDMSDFQQLQVPIISFQMGFVDVPTIASLFFFETNELFMGPSWCVLGKETSTSYWTGWASIFTSFSGVRRMASLMISHQPRCVAGVLHGGLWHQIKLPRSLKSLWNGCFPPITSSTFTIY